MAAFSGTTNILGSLSCAADVAFASPATRACYGDASKCKPRGRFRGGHVFYGRRNRFIVCCSSIPRTSGSLRSSIAPWRILGLDSSFKASAFLSARGSLRNSTAPWRILWLVSSFKARVFLLNRGASRSLVLRSICWTCERSGSLRCRRPVLLASSSQDGLVRIDTCSALETPASLRRVRHRCRYRRSVANPEGARSR